MSQLSENSKLIIAKHILKDCYWGNTSLTPQEIVDRINEPIFAKRIFNAILQNSSFMIIDLALFDKKLLKKLILEKSKNLGNFNKQYLKRRLNSLINLYIDSSYSARKRVWN